MIKNINTEIRKLIENDPQSAEELGMIGRETKLQVVKGRLNPANKDNDSECSDKNNRQQTEKKSASQIILKLFENITLFNDGNNGYAILPIKEHMEIWNINDPIVADWIHEKFYRTTGGVPPENAVKSSLKVLNARAKFDGDKHNLNYRIAKYDNAIWYDLTNENCHAVKITANNYEIVSSFPIIFKRNTSQENQVIPLRNGDLDMIFKYVNISPEFRLLFKAYLVSCFIPNIPHPAIILYGEKGGVKSTTAKIIKKLVDPCKTEVINSLNQPEQQLSQTFQHNYWLCFDNVSKITDRQSDMLCGAVTGSGFQKRELYTNDRTVVYNYRNCIAITGTTNVAEQDDFLDRCILFPLERISDAERKMDSVIWEGFEEDRPYILGAIFDILSQAMGKYSTVKLDKLSRMADFNYWAVAIAEAIGDGLGEEFQQQYKSNMDRQNFEALINNPFAFTVMAFAHKLNGKTWEGSASDLLEKLKITANEENIDTKCPQFPKSSNYVTKNLNARKSNLAGVGIQFFHRYNSRKVSHITLAKIPYNTTPPERNIPIRNPVTKTEIIPILNFSEGEI